MGALRATSRNPTSSRRLSAGPRPVIETGSTTGPPVPWLDPQGGRRRVYIAGPLSHVNFQIREANVERAVRMGRMLLRHGYAPLIPHLSHFMDPTDAEGYETWLACDFAWIEVADAVWRIAGKSSGTDREVAVAQALGIPVVSTLYQLRKALQ